jgi:hypothetical protein
LKRFASSHQRFVTAIQSGSCPPFQFRTCHKILKGGESSYDGVLPISRDPLQFRITDMAAKISCSAQLEFQLDQECHNTRNSALPLTGVRAFQDYLQPTSTGASFI